MTTPAEKAASEIYDYIGSESCVSDGEIKEEVMARIIQAAIDESLPKWQPIETAPLGELDVDGPPIRVLIEDGPCSHQYYAFHRLRTCTGSCTPNGMREHELHQHEEWIICDGWGEELHPPESYASIKPTHWMPLPQPPEDVR